jgi:DNA-binding NtrC family response regulator
MAETVDWKLEGEPDLALDRKVLLLGSDAGCDLRVAGLPGQALQFLVLANKVTAEALRPGARVDGESMLVGGRAALEDGSRLELGGRAWTLRRNRPQGAVLSIEPVLQAVETLVEAPDPRAVLPQLLEFAAQHVNATAGVLLSADKSEALATWPAGQVLEHSSSAVKACLEAGKAVLWADAGPSDAPLEGPSIIRGGIRSILVAPMRDPDNRIEAFLYLHRTGQGDPFGELERKAFERFTQSLGRVLTAARRHQEDRMALESFQASDSAGLLAASSLMQGVVAQARRFSNANVPVLVLGETGTGKELLARLVHRSSPRRNGPFLAVNCAAIPASLMEAELFGHEKGAFTGATSERQGLFEAATGGTLFLDEIGELEPQLQAALLRVLQEKTIRRVGSSSERSVDVRVVAATHRDLERMVDENRFRRDLLFRLNVACVRIPPLRDRHEDILPLARLFVQRAATEFGLEWNGMSRSAEKSLLRHAWPGNVRELENRMQRALLEAGGARLEPEHFGFGEDRPTEVGTLQEAREAAERVAIQKALTRAGGNLTQAGSILGVDRKVLRDVMKRLGMYHAGHDSAD